MVIHLREEEIFEAISHPIRIKILKLLSEKPRTFSELKRKLGIKSSGKLDYHIKKLDKLITVDNDGRYTLTSLGYAALQTVNNVRRIGWQKRAFIIACASYSLILALTLWKTPSKVALLCLVLTTAWFVYYSYIAIVKRGVLRMFGT